METKFTDGIWLHSVVNKEIAIHSSNGTEIFKGTTDLEFKETVHNARLIASAPELLNALLDLTNQLENEHVSEEFCSPLIEKAREIIKKATT